MTNGKSMGQFAYGDTVPREYADEIKKYMYRLVKKYLASELLIELSPSDWDKFWGAKFRSTRGDYVARRVGAVRIMVDDYDGEEEGAYHFSVFTLKNKLLYKINLNTEFNKVED